MATRLACAAWLAASASLVANAQNGPIHSWHSTQLPPGAVAQGQLLRGGPLPGYFQPLQIVVPQGAKVSVVSNGQFDEPRPGPALVGMLIGPVYPLKITHIPFNEGAEVYPTIEVINRLYPPEGLQLRFPVPIQITQEDLELAISGRFVTRVVYLEPPPTALPRRDHPGDQRYFEVAPNQDPLTVADQLGRPMAIVRLGSRIPDIDQPDGFRSFGGAPLLVFPNVPSASDTSPSEAAPGVSDSAIERQSRHIPRVPLDLRTARNPSSTMDGRPR